MKPEEMRRAIAGACGWWFDDVCQCWRHEAFVGMYEAPPNYPEDANAMRQAIKHLEDDEMLDYIRYLVEDVCACACVSFGVYTQMATLVRATPAQQAQAFLMAKDRWKEDV